MKRIIIVFFLALLLPCKAAAAEFTAPQVPNSAEYIFPEEQESLEDGLRSILLDAAMLIKPSAVQASKICGAVVGITLLITLCLNLPGSSKTTTETVGAIGIGYIFMRASGVLIQLGESTITELSEYGKLLLPVLTAAVAAQGGVGTSATIYSGTVIFDSLLCGLISNVFLPTVYIFLALAIASSVMKEEMLDKIKSFIKWAMTWCLKLILYVFIGYLGITGVVSGTADAAAVKAAKLTISGAVPVVGGILSDASETILVSVALMKNAAGIYGMLVFAALFVGPFVKLGVHYVLIKLTGGICKLFGSKPCSELVCDFCSAMGMLLAATGTECLILMISTVCFMKGTV